MKEIPILGKSNIEFQAKNIWAAVTERDYDQYVLFRKNFLLDESGKVKLELFADTYYNLYVDGVFLHRGPIRRHELNAFYDEIFCEMNVGEHTIAVLVHYLGKEFAGHRKACASFWAQISDASGKMVVATDETWKAVYCDAFLNDRHYFFTHIDYTETIDMRKYPDGWELPDFDDSGWANAIVTSEVAKEPDMHRDFMKRPVRLFSYDTRTAEIILRGTYTDPEGTDPANVYKTRTYCVDGSCERPDGIFAVAGVDCTMSVTVTVTYSGATEGSEMLLGYDDKVDAVGIPDPIRMGSFYADRLILKGGSGSASIVMPRGIRYVIISVPGTDCMIEDVKFVSEEFPFTECRPFVSGNSYFTRLYEQSARTQRVCTVDGFSDCASRERVLWLGDAYMDCLGNYYSEPDKGLLLMTLYEHAAGQMESGALGGYNSSDLRPAWLQMSSYNLMWLHMLCDYILFTGDVEGVMPLKETARGILRFIRESRNEEGIIDSNRNNCSTFWDWGYSEPEGESLKVTAYYIQTIERIKDISFFEDIVKKEMISELDGLRKVCFERFWDKERRVFHDGGKRGEALHPLSTQNANVQAIAAGICPEELKAEMLAKVFDKDELDEIPFGLFSAPELHSYETKILPCGTMYGSFYLAKALFDSGHEAEAIDFIEEVWGDFDGLPTLPEARRNGENEGSFTMCHGWSAAPAFLLPMYVLGIRPRKDGWKETLFAPPKIGQVEVPSAKGVVKTPYGEITAQWTRMDGGIRIYLDAPEEIELYVQYEGQEYAVEKGCKEWFILK